MLSEQSVLTYCILCVSCFELHNTHVPECSSLSVRMPPLQGTALHPLSALS